MKHCDLPLKKLAIILLWLFLWQIKSLQLHNSIILVGPLEVICALWTQIFTSDFWQTIVFSFGKISLGFLLAFLAGILTGGAAYHVSILKDLFSPFISFTKSVPVVSFIILALIWAGSKNLSVFIAFLVVFPILYISTIAGFESADPKLLEMAKVFQLSPLKRFLYIYWSTLLPHLTSACKVAVGMSWKAGIAAEVIGVPGHSIGEKLYMAKIYLSTADLFAWTLVIIAISSFFEKIFLKLLDLASCQNKRTENRRTKLWS